MSTTPIYDDHGNVAGTFETLYDGKGPKRKFGCSHCKDGFCDDGTICDCVLESIGDSEDEKDNGPHDE